MPALHVYSIHFISAIYVREGERGGERGGEREGEREREGGGGRGRLLLLLLLLFLRASQTENLWNDTLVLYCLPDGECRLSR